MVDLTVAPEDRPRLEALTATVGRSMAELYGTTITRLIAPLAAADTTADVESVLDWPEEEGIALINGEAIEYDAAEHQSDGTGKLTGLERDAAEAKLHPIGSMVSDVSRTFSRRDQARADVLVTRASGGWLHRLARNHALVRPPWVMSDEHLRNLFRVLMWLDSGTWWAVWRVLDAAFAPWATEGEDGVTAAANQRRLTVASAPFKAHHLHRYILVSGLPRRISLVAGDGSYVELFPGSGPWWVGATFGDATGVEWKLIPFMLEEDHTFPGTLIVHVFVPSSVSVAPPTYLQPAGAAATPVGVPKGGQLMPDSELAGAGNQPLYLTGSFTSHVKLLLREVLVLGAHVVVIIGSE